MTDSWRHSERCSNHPYQLSREQKHMTCQRGKEELSFINTQQLEPAAHKTSFHLQWKQGHESYLDCSLWARGGAVTRGDSCMRFFLHEHCSNVCSVTISKTLQFYQNNITFWLPVPGFALLGIKASWVAWKDMWEGILTNLTNYLLWVLTTAKKKMFSSKG